MELKMNFRGAFLLLVGASLSLLDQAKRHNCTPTSNDTAEEPHNFSQPIISRKILQDSISIRVEEDGPSYLNEAENRSTFRPPEMSELVVEPLLSRPLDRNNRKQNFHNSTFQNQINSYNFKQSTTTTTTERPPLGWEPISYITTSTTTAHPSILLPTTSRRPLVFIQPQVNPMANGFMVSDEPDHQEELKKFNQLIRLHSKSGQTIQSTGAKKTPSASNNRSKYLHLLPFARSRVKKVAGPAASRGSSVQAISLDDLQSGAQSEFNPVVMANQQQQNANLLTAQQMLAYLHLPPVGGYPPPLPGQINSHPQLDTLAAALSAAGQQPVVPQAILSPQVLNPSQLLMQAQQLLNHHLKLQQHQQQPAQQRQQLGQAKQYYNSINAQLPSANKLHNRLKEQPAVELADVSGQPTYSLLTNNVDLTKPDEQAAFEIVQHQLPTGSLTAEPPDQSTGVQSNLVQKGEAALVQMLETMLKEAMTNGTVPDLSSANNVSSKAPAGQPYQQQIVGTTPMPMQTGPFDNNNNHEMMLFGPAESHQPDQLDMYPFQYAPTTKKRSKNKKKNPSVRVQKRPYISSAASSRHPQGFVNTNNDLQPAGTFHKWKYPWRDEDDEEEGETEVNIRFFNNFSRMGPLGTVARAGGGASLIVSLIFLILSNFSLAATVIAHGISSLLRQLSGSPDRVKMLRAAKSMTTTTEKPQIQNQTKNPFLNNTVKLDSKIKAFGSRWL